jgi:hypothetical protein
MATRAVRNTRKKVEEIQTEAPTLPPKKQAAIVKIDKYHQRIGGIKIIKDMNMLEKARVIKNPYDDVGTYAIEFDVKGYDKSILLLHSRDNKLRVFYDLNIIAEYLKEELGIKGVIEFLLSD